MWLQRHTAALERAQLADGSFGGRAGPPRGSLSEQIQHTRGGGDWEAWADSSPFGGTAEQTGTKDSSGQATIMTERRLKKAQTLDQSDGGEFAVGSDENRALMFQRYISRGLANGRRRTDFGATQRLEEEIAESKRRPICRFCGVGAVRPEGLGSLSIQVLYSHQGRVRDELSPGTGT